MAEYKVTKVSEQPPRTYGEGDKLIYYIKVMLEGHDKPVSVGKKSPNAIKEGDVLIGTIEPTAYSEDKFKADRPQNGFKGQPKDEAAIKAMWAIGQAVEWLGSGDEDAIEPLAVKLFAMVDRVKASDGKTEAADKF